MVDKRSQNLFRFCMRNSSYLFKRGFAFQASTRHTGHKPLLCFLTRAVSIWSQKFIQSISFLFCFTFFFCTYQQDRSLPVPSKRNRQRAVGGNGDAMKHTPTPQEHKNRAARPCANKRPTRDQGNPGTKKGKGAGRARGDEPENRGEGR